MTLKLMPIAVSLKLFQQVTPIAKENKNIFPGGSGRLLKYPI